MIPQTWIVDPAPVPHHAVIPALEIQDWRELKKFSQRQREFVMKVSGFSELAWGSRGVFVGQDLPQREWSDCIEQAITSFSQRTVYPAKVLQRAPGPTAVLQCGDQFD